jgi:hypothetical protein
MLAFGALGVPACLAVPQWTALASADPSATLPLAGFYGSTLLLITAYGGVYALLPAFAADLYGARHVSAIFGRLMTAAPVAAVTGPLLLANLRAQPSSRFRPLPPQKMVFGPKKYSLNGDSLLKILPFGRKWI